jgi:ubiquinone/menaquinone biosynthesis C-methylase UbiE
MKNDELKIIAGNDKLVEIITDELVNYFNYLNLHHKNREDIKTFFINDEKTKTDLIDNLEKNVLSINKKRVLDIGCGKGGIVIACARKGAEAVGFDLDEREINIARLRAKSYNLGNISIFQGDAVNIPYPDNYFDLVTALSVLEHVKNLERVIKEMVRVTRPNGYCCVTVPNPIFPREGHYKVFYIPYLPKCLGKIYLKTRGFNPDFFDKYVTYPYPSISNITNIFRNSGTVIDNITEKDILLKIDKLKSVQIAKCKNFKEQILKIPVVGFLIAKLILLFDAYPNACLLARKDMGHL